MDAPQHVFPFNGNNPLAGSNPDQGVSDWGFTGRHILNGFGPHRSFNRLNRDSLQNEFNHLQAIGVGLPNYLNEDIKIGHVHIGPGNFFKSLIAPLADQLINERRPGWQTAGICTVNIHSDCAPFREQDGLYTMVQKFYGEERYRVIGSVRESLSANSEFGDPRAVMNRLSDPVVHTVSMTVTPKGYHSNEDGEWGNPKSAMGFILHALRHRFEANIDPFTLLSCDNTYPNGDLARNSLLKQARDRGVHLETATNSRGQTLMQYLESVPCPNTVVDRIAPSEIHQKDREMVQGRLGIADNHPTVTEPYGSLVIQKINGASPLAAGWAQLPEVRLADDVTPFSERKLFVVNGWHMHAAWLGTRAGMQYVHELNEHPETLDFIVTMMKKEIAPNLKPIPGEPHGEYIEMTAARMGNFSLPDTLNRLNKDGSKKFPARVFPTMRHGIETHDGEITRIALVTAAWFLTVSDTEVRNEPDPKSPTGQSTRYQGFDETRSQNSAFKVEDSSTVLAEFNSLKFDRRLLLPASEDTPDHVLEARGNALNDVARRFYSSPVVREIFSTKFNIAPNQMDELHSNLQFRFLFNHWLRELTSNKLLLEVLREHDYGRDMDPMDFAAERMTMSAFTKRPNLVTP